MNCSCYRKFEQTPSVLDCSNSGMTSLSDILVPNETSWLVAKDSKIEHLQWSEESRRNLQQMKYINFANSSISSIDPNFFLKLSTLGKIRYLNLADNKLKSFNKNIKKSGLLEEIYLSGNPIDCTCGILWFVKWLSYDTKIVKDLQSIRCVGGEWDGAQVYRLTKEQMGCLPPTL